MIRLLATAFVLFAVAAPAIAETADPALPPDITGGTEYARRMGGALSQLASVPLWTDNALDGYARRYRFTSTASSWIAGHTVQVMIDEHADGSAILAGKVYRRPERLGVDDWMVEEVEFRLLPETYSEFRELVDESGLWASMPESFRLRPGSYCGHGREVILEKRDADGYGLSEAEHCTTPDRLLLVIDRMLDLARFRTRRQWTPRMWWDQ